MRRDVVTVFGGTGFVGRHLIRRLAERGATVRVATRRPSAGFFLRPMGMVGQIVLMETAADNEASIARVISGARHVVNLVGVLHDGRGGDFERLHARLPGRIGSAAAAAGVRRVVQMSAIGADPGSTSAYARTKAAGETAVREARPDAVILRPSIVFGPEDSFFNRFAAMARLSPALPLIGGGRTRFQPVYVGDVAEAVIAGLERPEAPGRTYELGGPQTYTFRELMQYLLEVLGRRRLLVSVPFGIAALQARLAELLPDPLLTRDQVEMLKRDNVVAPDMPGLPDLGIDATPLEVVVPGYLTPFARVRLRIPAV